MAERSRFGLCRLFAWGGWFGIGVEWEGFFGLEALEFLEGVAVVAVGAVDAALEAGEIVVIAEDGLSEFDFFFGVKSSLGTFLPKLGFANPEAAEEPFGVDQGVDEHALFGSSGVEAVVVFGGEGLEVSGGFAVDDLSFGVDAGFECVLGGAGFARGGAGTGGFARVEAIGLDLFESCHGRTVAHGQAAGVPRNGKLLER